MRNDIQALRAAAVLLVVANHLVPNRVPGGYVGVDVFFVISGFLISSHLLRELDERGTISLPRFWSRRARRLLPAALLVLVVAVVAVLLILPNYVWQTTLQQAAAAAGYGLNWWLAGNSLDYFAQGDAQTVVTHYWSLSVEEQFYLVWPLLFLGIGLATRSRRPGRRRRWLLVAVATALIASFAWATYSSVVTPDAAYFETTGRGWEFAVGALVAMMRPLGERLRDRLAPLVWVAWAALIVVGVLLPAHVGVPGPAAAPAVLATAAIIAIGESSRPWSSRWLTRWRPVRVVGDTSYSIYLWHYPLIVLAPFVLHRAPSTVEKLALLAATLLLAWLTKNLIEDPVRFGPASRWRPRIVLAAALASILVLSVASVSGSALIDHRVTQIRSGLAADVAAPDPCFGARAALDGAACPDSHVLADPLTLMAAGPYSAAAIPGARCSDEAIDSTTVTVCTFGVPERSARHEVALVGDSHAYVWGPLLARLAPRYGLRVRLIALGNCPVSLDPALQTDGLHVGECGAWRSAVVHDVASDPRIDTVITSAFASDYTVDGKPDPGDGYADAWRTWLAAGKRVVAINDVPTMGEPLSGCLARVSGVRDTDCTVPAAVQRAGTALTRASTMVHDPRFDFVDLTDVFCDSVCHPIIGGIPVYYDGQHMTDTFAESFGDVFLARAFAGGQ